MIEAPCATPPSKTVNHPRALLFAEGLVSVSLQFLFMRHLLPDTGNGVAVTSVIVSLFLLSLAMGYHAGGKPHPNPIGKFSQNLLLAALTLCIGLSPWTSRWFFTVFDDTPRILAAGIYCMVFMTPAVFWLGQSMPLLSNAIRARSNGELSGTVLLFSTLGNVIGSLASVLLLMRYTSLGFTALTNIVILLVLHAYLSPRPVSMTAAATVALLAVASVYHAEQTLFKMTTHYANYQVVSVSHSPESSSQPSTQVLISNGLAQSSLDPSGQPAPYIQMIERQISQWAPKNSRILVVGAGGFTLGREFPDHTYEFVDIDPRLKSFVEEHFLQRPSHGTFVARDARQHLKSVQAPYDVLVLDTFSSTHAIPAHLATREYFELALSRVRKGGLIFINTIQRADFADEYSRRLHSTILSAIPYCDVTNPRAPSRTPSQLINRVYTCRAAEPSPILIDRVTSLF